MFGVKTAILLDIILLKGGYKSIMTSDRLRSIGSFKDQKGNLRVKLVDNRFVKIHL